MQFAISNLLFLDIYGWHLQNSSQKTLHYPYFGISAFHVCILGKAQIHEGVL